MKNLLIITLLWLGYTSHSICMAPALSATAAGQVAMKDDGESSDDVIEVHKKFICGIPGCKASFTANGNRTKHWAGVHRLQYFYECPVCSKKFDNFNHFKTHIKTYPEQNIPEKYRVKKMPDSPLISKEALEQAAQYNNGAAQKPTVKPSKKDRFYAQYAAFVTQRVHYEFTKPIYVHYLEPLAQSSPLKLGEESDISFLQSAAGQKYLAETD